jgi:hypothetical protein
MLVRDGQVGNKGEMIWTSRPIRKTSCVFWVSKRSRVASCAGITPPTPRFPAM